MQVMLQVCQIKENFFPLIYSSSWRSGKFQKASYCKEYFPLIYFSPWQRGKFQKASCCQREIAPWNWTFKTEMNLFHNGNSFADAGCSYCSHCVFYCIFAALSNCTFYCTRVFLMSFHYIKKKSEFMWFFMSYFPLLMRVSGHIIDKIYQGKRTALLGVQYPSHQKKMQ